MKIISFVLIISSLAFCGSFGIGIAGGGQYYEDYKSLTPEMLQEMFYGAELSLSAEALPNVFLEPSFSYLNNPAVSTSAAGCGLGLNIKPRLGNFPFVPYFGLKGTILFYSEMDIREAARAGQLIAYIENSSPKLIGAGFAGISLFLGKSMSLNCNYSYYSLAPQYGVEMVWAGLTYYINW